ncbi:MAG: insulinase family protein [Candidatus Glassbacteria bacterium]|nr:insulinase family protein [Candidatus Glassbacteria bacterium]
MHLKRNPLLLPAFLLLIGMQQPACPQSFDRIKAEVEEFTLANGMKFIVLERHQAPVVSFHVYADVGSANESYGITGISHLLEHMAFKGTRVVGTTDCEAETALFPRMDELYGKLTGEKLKTEPDTALIARYAKEFEGLCEQAKQYVINNEFFDMLLEQGDAGINAYTGADATHYVNSLPSNRLEFWMSMTSDRFFNPVFREFYKEKDVVMEERRLALETRPIGRLIEDFLAATFKAHPYHHSVVGHMSDLERITRRDVERYFSANYGPSNLTVAIVGDVNADEVREMARLYFERIPGGTRPEPVRTVEPEQWGEKHIKVSAQSQPVLIVGYHRPSARHQDHQALEALANIIGQGRSCRLYEVLVKESKIAAATGCFNGFPGDKFPNLIAFYAFSTPGRTSGECLELIDREIEKIKQESVTDEELRKFKRSTVKDLIDGMKSDPDMAYQLTYHDVVLGDWRLLFDGIAKVEAITAEDIKRVANQYLVAGSRTIGEIIPEETAD